LLMLSHGLALNSDKCRLAVSPLAAARPIKMGSNFQIAKIWPAAPNAFGFSPARRILLP
jgi:hypothetical protein